MSQHLINTCYKLCPSLVKSAIFQNNYFTKTAGYAFNHVCDEMVFRIFTYERISGFHILEII